MLSRSLEEIAYATAPGGCKRFNYLEYEIDRKKYKFYEKEGDPERQARREIERVRKEKSRNIRNVTFRYTDGKKWWSKTYRDYYNCRACQNEHIRTIENAYRRNKRARGIKKFHSKGDAVVSVTERPGTVKISTKRGKHVKYGWECIKRNYVYLKRRRATSAEIKRMIKKKKFVTDSCPNTPHPKQMCFCVRQDRRSAIRAALTTRITAGAFPIEGQVFSSVADVTNAEVSRQSMTAQRGDYTVIWVDRCP